MSAIPETKAKTSVTLLRPGLGKEDIELPEGATLADLIRAAGANTADLEILVDGMPIEESVVLRNGMIVSACARAYQPSLNRSWRQTVGDFHDDPTFEAMMERVHTEREAEKQTS